MPVMTRYIRTLDESVQQLAEKIAVEIELATVSEKTSGTCWSVGKLLRAVSNKFHAGSVVLYKLESDGKTDRYGDPVNVWLTSVPEISIKSDTDFEKLNEILLKSAILVDYKKYMSKI